MTSEQSLVAKIEAALALLENAWRRHGCSLGVAFSGGKDSLVALHMVRTMHGGDIPLPVLSIDTGVKFPEVTAFRDRIAREWNVTLTIVRDETWAEMAASGSMPSTNSLECCRVLKVAPLRKAIADYGISGLITGIRRDEHETRAGETPVSTRDHPPHERIHPLLDFSEANVWEYIRTFDLPYAPPYDRGYRSLSCMPCTAAPGDDAPAATERGHRAPDKESVMAQLRAMGYF
ncbi:MAG: phosphoadenosine phosphosulfate reductase family protein [Oceanidesulfovibrio sp.]